jgi:arsenite methyltransferase
MKHPDYGIDAPGVVRNLLIAGLVLVVCSFLVPPFTISGITFNLNTMEEIMGVILIAEAALMLLYSKYGKFHHRDRMLHMVHWKGNETVLDVGTGAGLLMIGAAKKLATGRSVGIDIWSTKDLSGNTAKKALDNAAMEGVAESVEVRNENICNTSFGNASFDVVLSNLCLHNIADKMERQKACREIARILKPGGVAVISDFKNTAEYSKEFSKAGLSIEKKLTSYLKTFPPLTVIKARKT